jgi:transcriptional regulator with XRE-family HTH domain
MEAAGIAKYGEKRWQTQLAEDSGVALATISKIKRGGTKNPQPDNFLRIADALGVEYRWLATGQGRRERRDHLTEEERRWPSLRGMLSPEQQQSLTRFLDTVRELHPRSGEDRSA